MLRPRVVLFLAPIGVYLLWLLSRLVFRRKPSRFEVSVGLSILLLLYFLTTVGTGIFWVAAQELPIFDWHYLPGYLLLLIGLTHVVLHWKTLALFFRKRAPEALVARDGSGFRGWVRGTSFALLGLAVGGALFLAGTRFASQRFSFTDGGGELGTLSSSNATEGNPLEPRRLRAAPVSVTLAQLYHEGCSYPNRFNLPGLTIRTRPIVIKDYPGLSATRLPEPQASGGTSILDAYWRWYSAEGQEATSLRLDQVSTLLYHTQGISKTLQLRGMAFDLRTAPSAGALFPVNVYLLASRVEGLASGLYYYNPKQDALVLVQAGEHAGTLAGLSGSPELIRSAPVTLLFTSTFGRTAFKYGERSYRYVNMDTGHAAYNAALCAASLGLRAPMVARFDDAGVNRLLGLDGMTEGTLLIQPLGAGKGTPGKEPRFLPAPFGGTGGAKGSFLDLIHGGTSLRLGQTMGVQMVFPEMDAPAEGRVSLPAPASGKPLFTAIRGRRSVRNYSGGSIELAELSALCASSAGGGKTPGITDPLLSGSAPLQMYVMVRDVRSLAPGIYRYHPRNHELEPLRAGDFSKACMKACFEQEFCGTANAVFFKTVKWDSLAYPDGDRGYRYACLRAGFMGEGLYLQGAALNLGVCGVGAFEDGAVAKLLEMDPAKEICLYVTAAGKL